MDYNTDSARKSLTSEEAFGQNLKNDPNLCITSPQTFRYNCIAFAMGMDDRWVDSVPLPWHWWPLNVPKEQSCAALKEAFVYFGFEDCGMDDTMEEDYDKVALYQKDGFWTHAARVVDTGIYHSKFGSSYDGRHSNGDVLQKQYGDVYVIMRRRKADSVLTEQRKGNAPGVIHLNVSVNINGHKNHLVAYGGKTYLAEIGREVRVSGSQLTIL